MTDDTSMNTPKDSGKRRRRRAFGTVERLPSGRFRARVPDLDGRYVSAPVTFATKTEAAVWVDLQRADQVRAVWKAPPRRGSSPTVGEYVDRWITEHPSARASTKELYASLLRTCITPELGRVRVAQLTPERVRRWHYELGERLAADAAARRAALQARGRDVSPVTVSDGRARQAQAYRLLRAAMATAVVDEVIDAQPCRIAGAGTPRRALGRVPDIADRLLSPDQVNAVADAMPARYRALVLAAAWSGLRQGELLALTRADLDLNAMHARVRVRRGVRRSDNGTMEVDLPKTRASVRTVSLPTPLVAALVAHLDEFVGEDADAPVFATVSGTNPARSNLNSTFRRAIETAGVRPVRFHDLRHVAQVYAAEAGATLPELMARMGHASPAAAMVYLHARAERDHSLTDALSAAMAVSDPR
jgi:integrase